MSDNYCKICFNKIEDLSLHNLFRKKSVLCEECFSKFKPKFHYFKLDNNDGLAIYEYDSNIKELLFKFKGCFDYEMKDVFLDRFIHYLRIRYKGYVVVPIPSYFEDDELRGFNHVEEIYNRLKLKVLKIIKKTKKEKQANKNKKERMKVGNILEATNLSEIKNKKVLLVDDVMTTGSSLRAAISLLKPGQPKKISILVVAKNIEKKRKDNI